MKRFLLLAVAVLAFVGCNNAFEDEGNARFEQTTLPTLMAGFEEDTRTYVEQNTYLRWHADDRLTIFYGNTMNRQYKFNGKSGDNSGSFSHIPSGNIETGNSFDHIYAVYPYDATISLDDINRSMSLTLPAEQTYAEDSFGRGANTMVAVTENLEDTFLSFKNVGGYLKIRLYGEGTVKSIELRGNNGEKIAGNANITATYGGVPKIAMADDATESIMLDCGDGVELSADAENPTEFWVVVPPTEFSKGITISVTNAYDAVFEKSTSNKIVVERNIIQPMSAVEVEFEVYDPPKPAQNEIWYTSTDGEIVTPNTSNVFGATIVSNTYENGKGIITFDGAVTTIRDYAFFGCESLTSITIPDSVTMIGESAFEDCRSLTSVIIGDSVTTIGHRAFSGCYSLTSVTIGDSVTTIGNWAFRDCTSLTSVTIPDSVTTIGDSAFDSCESLTSVTIGDSVTTIGNGAFYSCNNLTSVTIGDSVTTIGDRAFYGCFSLTSVTIGDSVTTIGYRAFSNCNSLKEFKGKYATDNGRCLIIDGVLNSFANDCEAAEYAIPDSVTTIGHYAFEGCRSLTSVTIPDSVTTIGDYAFSYCESLTSVTIPDSVTTIENGAFYCCSRLTSVTIGDSVTAIGHFAFYDCNSLTSITIPDSVTMIGQQTFDGCESLTSVTIPDSVTKIGGAAFFDCHSLTSVTIPDSVTEIGYQTFCYCNSLTSVTIPDSVTTIGNSAFSDCDSLTSITIPDSVTTIGDGAFSGCDSLKEFKGKYATDNGRCLIKDNTIIAYAEASGTEYTIPDSVTTIGDLTFYACGSLTSVTIGDSVTTIGLLAFFECKKLTSVTIGVSVTTIGESAFFYCESLTSVYCKATTPPTMGSSVFAYAPLEAIYVPTASVNDYKTADGWSDYADVITGFNF